MSAAEPARSGAIDPGRGAEDERHWVAFLRAINVGGRRLTNDALRDAVAACGCEDVQAHQSTGNLVVRDARPDEELTGALEQGLARQLGYEVPVFLRRPDAVRAIAKAAPFTAAQLAASAGKRQVIFLRAPLPLAAGVELQELVPEDEVVVPVGAELHWLPRAGVSDSSLAIRRVEALVGPTTIRTHAAVQRLVGRLP